MRPASLAMVALLCAAGLTHGQSVIEYQLHLGGDNHSGDWEAFINTPFTPGTQDSVIIDCSIVDCYDLVLTWDVTVRVTGVHSGGPGDGYPTNGAARLGFDLVLEGEGGRIVDEVEFFSSMNDGDADGLRGSIQGTDPLEVAAACLGFDVEGNGPPAAPGRIHDRPIDGGPFMDYVRYPSAGSHAGGIRQNGVYTPVTEPPNPTLLMGELRNIEIGYTQFVPAGAGGQSVAGVGLEPGEGPMCARGLGIRPILEGQLRRPNPVGCSEEFTLRLVPHTSPEANMVLRGDFDCVNEAPIDAAVPANDVLGDEVIFVVQGLVCCVSPANTLGWYSVHTHSALGELRIPIDASATVTGTATTEPRRDGVQRLEIDLDIDATEEHVPGNIMVNGGMTVVSDYLMNGGQTLVVELAGSQDQSCYCIDISQSLLAGFYNDSDCYIAALEGDSNDDGIVNFIDLSQVKANLGIIPPDFDPRWDINTDGLINMIDIANIKAKAGNRVTCP